MKNLLQKMRNYIHLKINEMNHVNINNDQIRWEFLKYEVGKFSKTLEKELRGELGILENKLKLHKQKFEIF